MGKISIPHFSIERWGFIFCNTVDRQKENLINFREIDIRKAIKTVDENPTLRTGRESVEYDLYYHGSTYLVLISYWKGIILKGYLAFVIIIVGVVLSVWVLFYITSEPLTAAETTVVTGISIAIYYILKWIWNLIKKGKVKHE